MQFVERPCSAIRSVSPSRIASGALALVAASVPLASAQTKLNPPLARPIGGDVQRVQISTRGLHVVYVADQDRDGVFELYTTRAGGALTARKLSMELPASGDVEPDFALGDARVVFRADAHVDQQFELFSVPYGGTAPIVLSPPLGPGGSVGDASS